MATKNRTTVKKKAPAKKTASKTVVAKVAKAPKATVSTKGRHPKARVTAAHGGKAELAKSLAPSLVRGDEDAAQIEAQLKTASNAQLLRLQRTVKTVAEKWGGRDKLIAAIGTAQNKSKDKDYLAKLATLSLPQLVDLAKSAERRARA